MVKGSGKTLVFITNNFSLPAATICGYKSRWHGTLLQVDQAPSGRIKQFYGTSENAVKTQIDCRLGLRPRRHRQDSPRLDACSTLCYRSSRVTLFEGPYIKHLRESKTDATLRLVALQGR